jgi:hypothetical protein
MNKSVEREPKEKQAPDWDCSSARNLRNSREAEYGLRVRKTREVPSIFHFDSRIEEDIVEKRQGNGETEKRDIVETVKL